MIKAENIKYIAIQGAGGKGAAYLGVLSALEKTAVLKTNLVDGDTKRIFTQLLGISGTSAGSITALMLSLGYTAEQTNSMVIESPLFSLALGEKSNNSLYRAYKSNGSEAPDIGFTSFKTKYAFYKKMKSKIPPADKYFLSNSQLSFKQDSLKLEKNILSKVIKFGFPSKAIVAGLLNSLTSSDVLEHITDEIVEDVFPFFEILTPAFKTAPTSIRDGVEAKFFDIDFLQEVRELFINHGGEARIGTGLLILVLILFFIWFTAANYYTDGVFGDKDDICSPKNRRKKKNYERWSTIKIVIRLIWNANANRIPINKIPILGKFIKAMDDFFSEGKGSLKDKKKALVNLAALFVMVRTAIRDGEDGAMAKMITKMLKKDIIPTLLKPISIMLKNGGILSGGRIRYLHARLIYEKVQLKGEEGNYTFHLRKKDLSEFIDENIELIKGKKLKSLKKTKRAIKKLEKEFKYKKSSNLTEILEFQVKVTEFFFSLKQNTAQFAIKNVIKKKLYDLEDQISVEEKAIKKIEDDLAEARELLELFEMREHLEHIERYYSFEEHYKLFPHDLTICASNITSGHSVFFNRHLTPDFSLVEAVAASMNIPGLWRPSAIQYTPVNGGKKKGGKPDKEFYKKYYYGWFVDGGLNNNIPLFAFNGYLQGDKSAEAIYWTPEEMAKNNDLFPEKNIIGVSNFGGRCSNESVKQKGVKQKRIYTGGAEGKKTKSDGELYIEGFTKQYDLLSVVGDILGSMFGYGYKLRGFDLEPYSKHILTVDTGFMGTLDFAANFEEVFRTEAKNYHYALKFLGKSDASSTPIHAWDKSASKAKKDRKNKRGSGNMFKRKQMGYRPTESKFFDFK